MTKEDYLEFLGYSNEYTVKSSEDIKDYLTLERFRNNIFPVADPTGIKLFGKGAKIVSIKWFEEMTLKYITPEATPTDPVPPIAATIPEVPKTAVPPVPTKEVPLPPVPVQEDPIVDATISETLKRRIDMLIKAGWVKYNSQDALSSPEGSKLDDIHFQGLEDLTEDAFMKLLHPTIEKNNSGDYLLTKDERLKMIGAVNLRAYGGQYCSQDAKFAISSANVDTYTDKAFKDFIEEVDQFYKKRYEERCKRIHALGLSIKVNDINDDEKMFTDEIAYVKMKEFSVINDNDPEFEKRFTAMSEYMKTEEYLNKLKPVQEPKEAPKQEPEPVKEVKEVKEIEVVAEVVEPKQEEKKVKDVEKLKAIKHISPDQLARRGRPLGEGLMFELMRVGTALASLQEIADILSYDDLDEVDKLAKIQDIINRL